MHDVQRQDVERLGIQQHGRNTPARAMHRKANRSTINTI
jgi:hypothetical protein